MKKIVYLLVFAFLFFIPSLDLKAATLGTGRYVGDATNLFVPPSYMFDENLMSSEAVKDEAGHFKSGYFYYNTISNGWIQQRNYLYNTEDGFLYITRKESPDSTLDEGLMQYLYYVNSPTSIDRIYVDANYEYNGKPEEATPRWYDSYHWDYGGVSGMQIGSLRMPIEPNGDFSEYDEKKNRLSFFCTNLPVFDIDDVEAIEKYIQSGDCSGSLNGENTSQPKYDESIELPRLLVTYGKITNLATETKLTVRWYPPLTNIEDYVYDIRFKIHYKNMDNHKYYDTEFLYLNSNQPYCNSTYYDLNTGEKIVRGSNVPEDKIIDNNVLKKHNFVKSDDGWLFNSLIDIIYIDYLTIQVRNRIGEKASNWVTLKVNAEGGSYASVEDDEGNVVDSDEYNGNVDNRDNHLYDPSNPSSDNDGSNGADWSLKDIMSYIKSGFGLLGNAGLISLISGLFSYVPASVWVLIRMAIAISITIMLLALVKRFVFG